MRKQVRLLLLLSALLSVIWGKTSAQCNDSSYFRFAASFIYDAVILKDTSKIIGVGDNGYIIKSIDGGKSWRNIPLFQSNYLRAIHAATDTILYAVGTNNPILKSEDQGETWFPVLLN